MALTIQNVLPRSLASKHGIKTGDVILSINGNRIQDFFDLQYYASDYELLFELVNEDGKPREVQILRETSKALGIEPEPYRCRFCQNRCIFCFIDQMPPKLRETLYVKDDDYLYSFVFGNYITLTNLRSEDFQRIIDQHISPLYVSVHTTDSGLRKQMMHYRQELDIAKTIRRLSSKGIEFHFQIVVVPGYNDGETLKETIRTLLHPRISTLSIGLVPVGLTKYRNNLVELIPFDAAMAEIVLDTTEELSVELKSDAIFCADEFYVLAEREIPPKEHYRDYPQIENGIGMLRLTMENFQHKKRSFLKEIRKKGSPILFVTGKSAARHIQSIADYINRKMESEVARVCIVINDYMGHNITVSGLLTHHDILAQVQAGENEVIALPNNIFNHDGLSLDGLSPLEFKESLRRELLVIDHLFEYWDWI
ncbi:MAG: DUF512 domain-containing protein [Candidatus Cloacimonadaceae bacterium]|nr:DUF512 domain-containing protein [Candidatus Cloacimonadaceae bacterium]